nr:hypothetical protein [uncultured Devosia sp.]
MDALIARCVEDPEKRRRYHKTIGKVTALAEERNVIVHSRLGPSNADGLRIRKIQSNSKPSMVPVEWTIEGLLEKIAYMWILQLELEDMSDFDDAEDIWIRGLGPELPPSQQTMPPTPPPEEED